MCKILKQHETCSMVKCYIFFLRWRKILIFATFWISRKIPQKILAITPQIEPLLGLVVVVIFMMERNITLLYIIILFIINPILVYLSSIIDCRRPPAVVGCHWGKTRWRAPVCPPPVPWPPPAAPPCPTPAPGRGGVGPPAVRAAGKMDDGQVWPLRPPACAGRLARFCSGANTTFSSVAGKLLGPGGKAGRVMTPSNAPSPPCSTLQLFYGRCKILSQNQNVPSNIFLWGVN